MFDTFEWHQQQLWLKEYYYLKDAYWVNYILRNSETSADIMSCFTSVDQHSQRTARFMFTMTVNTKLN